MQVPICQRPEAVVLVVRAQGEVRAPGQELKGMHHPKLPIHPQQQAAHRWRHWDLRDFKSRRSPAKICQDLPIDALTQFDYGSARRYRLCTLANRIVRPLACALSPRAQGYSVPKVSCSLRSALRALYFGVCTRTTRRNEIEVRIVLGKAATQMRFCNCEVNTAG